MPEAKTLSEKIWDAHVVRSEAGQPDLLYIDLHLVHEVTSAQAFEGLRMAGRKVRRPELTVATVDHNVPTLDRNKPWPDPLSIQQVDVLDTNVAEFDVPYFGINDVRQGIVHVIGPEQGITQPGMTIVCGDSHTSTHGAIGSLAIGIGTSEVEHVLATQTLTQMTPEDDVHRGQRRARPRCHGQGRHPRDHPQHRRRRRHRLGHRVPRRHHSQPLDGGSHDRLQHVDRGWRARRPGRARTTRPSPTSRAAVRTQGQGLGGRARPLALAAHRRRARPSTRTSRCNAADIDPHVTWGTTPAQSVDVTGRVPNPDSFGDAGATELGWRSLTYMDLKPDMAIEDITLDRVFIGSCTNSRIEDLREAASIVRGYKVNPKVNAIVVPGSGLVKAQAEQEGLDKIFIEAGFEWRDAGCSMCLGMNPDFLLPGDRCASTSNRNFEGRQGPGGRTHLVSPIMAAAAAIAGPLRRHSQLEGQLDGAGSNHPGPGPAPEPLERGHGRDHPREVPEAGRAHRLRPLPLR